MPVLSDTALTKRLNKKDVCIYPLKEKNITGIGYDLSIGICRPLTETKKFIVGENYYVIPPNCYAVIITQEYTWLSGRYCGTLHARGTLAAKGLYLNCTNVDPNFQGQMVMSVKNISNVNVKVAKNEHFITLIIHSLRKPTKTLVGDEGTKNSMRVITQMIETIYPKKNAEGNSINRDQRESLNDLNQYLVNCNQTIHPKFNQLVSKAAAPVSFSYLGSRARKLFAGEKTLFQRATSIVQFLLLIVVMYMVSLNLYQWYLNGNSDTQDQRMLVLLLVAAVALVGSLSKK